MKKIFIFGSGGFLKEQYFWIKDTIKKDSDYKIESVVAKDKKEKFFYETPIITEDEIEYNENIYIYLAIGSIEARLKIINKFLKYNFYTLIHPTAVISDAAKIGKGCTISPNTIIAGDAEIGDFNCFNFNSMISHDCKTGINNIYSPGAKVLGWCNIGNNNYFGCDSVMLPKLNLGNSNIIGANATLTKNFNSDNVLVGTPAKFTNKNKK